MSNAPSATAVRSRNWVFVLNNWSEAEVEALKEQQFKFLVFGYEVSQTGTPHLQGQICFENGKSAAAVRKIIPRAHIEVTGDLEASIKYCLKGEGTPDVPVNPNVEQYGTRPMSKAEKGQAGADYWAATLESAKRGRFDELSPQVQFTQAKLLDYIYFRELKNRVLEDTTEQHLWYYGKSRTGKSRKARQDNPDAYLKMCNKWWDGYRDQEVVIIEDFDPAHSVLGHHIKIWGDRYPFPAEIKGTGAVIRPRLVIVTSNYHPSEIWTEEAQLEPILMRFKCVEFTLAPMVFQ